MASKDFPVGTRVQKDMGCRLHGVIVARFPWRESTDGTYGDPRPGYVAVLWDDGTKGYEYPYHIKKETKQ